MKISSQQLKRAESFLVTMLILNMILLVLNFVLPSSIVLPTSLPELLVIERTQTIIHYIIYFVIASLLLFFVVFFMILNAKLKLRVLPWMLGMLYAYTVFGVFVVFYLHGFVQLLSLFFQNYLFPKLSDFTNFLLANLFNWILSGIIGNFFYDLLKKLTLKKDHN